jgi:hypothetical protein
MTRVRFGRKDRGDSLSGILFTSNSGPTYAAVILVDPKGKAAFLTPEGKPGALARTLLDRGQAVLVFDAFLTGEMADAKAVEGRKRPFGAYFSTYNRTDIQERVQDLITATAYLRARGNIRNVTLLGTGRAGLWALLAAPTADRVAADCVQLDTTKEEALLAEDLFAPNILRMGDFRTAALLAAPRPLLLHNMSDKFAASSGITDAYKILKLDGHLLMTNALLTETAIADWIVKETPHPLP